MRIEDMTPRSAYELGYRDGESSASADVEFFLAEFTIVPEEVLDQGNSAAIAWLNDRAIAKGQA